LELPNEEDLCEDEGFLRPRDLEDDGATKGPDNELELCNKGTLGLATEGLPFDDFGRGFDRGAEDVDGRKEDAKGFTLNKGAGLL
jgi:hypothetical protein